MKIDSIKIKLLLGEKGMTQENLANQCGVSRQNINATLARSSCSAAKACTIAAALGVPVQEIIKEG